jgi:hypothetical protein
MIDNSMVQKEELRQLNSNNERQRAYRAVFKASGSDELNQAALLVLEDLSTRCMMSHPTFSNDALEMAKRAALKDFFMETMEILNLDYGALYRIDYTYNKE